MIAAMVAELLQSADAPLGAGDSVLTTKQPLNKFVIGNKLQPHCQQSLHSIV